MRSSYESELETMLKLTEEKLELCLKINNDPAKKDRLFNEYFILFKLLNQGSKTTNKV